MSFKSYELNYNDFKTINNDSSTQNQNSLIHNFNENYVEEQKQNKNLEIEQHEDLNCGVEINNSIIRN